MPKFQVKTQSIFEHIYWIEAPTKQLAVEAVLDNYESDYMQKHIGEGVIETKEIPEDQTYSHWYQEQKSLSYD
jgi:hypothetical protein